MSDSALILSLGFAVLLVVGVPFAIALLLVTAAVLVVADIEPILLAQTLIAGTQSFSLLAIPFFMLAGEIMSAGGLSQRLIRVADVMVRHLPGGMGHVTVVSACIFAAISGSAPATTAAIGAILIPAMVARGYDKAFATALAVSAGVLGPLIPPSIAAVIWGVIAEQSIARLFMAGVGPGLLLAVGLMVIASVHALRHGIRWLDCLSTRTAVPFYQSLGFRVLHEVEIVGCCETLSERRKKSGFFGSFGGAHLLQYVGIVVHPTFLIWAAGHTREKSLPLADVVVSLARLRNVRVREYESRLIEDSGIEVFGFLEDVPQQVSAYIPLDAGAEAQQFLELLLSTANRSIL